MYCEELETNRGHVHVWGAEGVKVRLHVTPIMEECSPAGEDITSDHGPLYRCADDNTTIILFLIIIYRDCCSVCVWDIEKKNYNDCVTRIWYQLKLCGCASLYIFEVVCVFTYSSWNPLSLSSSRTTFESGNRSYWNVWSWQILVRGNDRFLY